jgi:hypothetical protein
LGVLFVHGIGQQLQGETLVRFADPLSRWFSRWLTRDASVEPEIGRAPTDARVSLAASKLAPGSDAPATSRLALDPAPEEGMGAPSDWLLAESWWAETFRPPKTSELLVWLLLVLPYMLIEQFYVPLRRSIRLRRKGVDGVVFTCLRVAAFSCLFVAALPVAALGVIPIVILLVPLLIPIPRVQAAAKTAAVKLANTVGDSFVLVSSSVQYDAMVSQVAADLAWLSMRTRKVAIVAHSQGAAVAYEALTRYGCPNGVRLIITVGQGLGKLMRMRALTRFRSTARFSVAWAGLVGFFLVAITVPQLAFTIWKNPTHEAAVWVVFGIGLFLAGAILAAYQVFWHKQLNVEPVVVRNERDEVVPWIDYYASADPVPNGPLFTRALVEHPNRIHEIEVWNRASVLTDHTSYVLSEDDFLSCLAQHLCRLDAGYRLPEESKSLLERGRWRGWWRVWWLTVARVFCFGAGLATLVRLWSHLTLLGTRVIDKTPHPIGTVVRVVSKPLRALIIVGSPSNAILVGGATVVVILASGYLILSIIWRFWEARDIHRFFQRDPIVDNTAPLGGWEFSWFLAAIGLGTAIAVKVCWTHDYVSTWNFVVHDWHASISVVGGLAIACPIVYRLLRRPLQWLEKWVEARYPRELVHGDPPDREPEPVSAASVYA